MIDLGDGQLAGDGISEIDRFFKVKVHSRCQPTALTPDFREQAPHQQTMADPFLEFFCMSKAAVKVNRILIASDFSKRGHILFFEGSGGSKCLTFQNALNGLPSNL